MTVNGQTLCLLLQTAQPLNLTYLQLEPAGQAFDFAFDSHRSVRTDSAGHSLGRTSDDANQASRLIPCAEFHDRAPSCQRSATLLTFSLPYIGHEKHPSKDGCGEPV